MAHSYRIMGVYSYKYKISHSVITLIPNSTTIKIVSSHIITNQIFLQILTQSSLTILIPQSEAIYTHSTKVIETPYCSITLETNILIMLTAVLPFRKDNQ